MQQVYAERAARRGGEPRRGRKPPPEAEQREARGREHDEGRRIAQKSLVQAAARGRGRARHRAGEAQGGENIERESGAAGELKAPEIAAEQVEEEEARPAQDVRVLVRGGSDIGAENDLGQTFTVTQVHEDEAAVVAAVLHPAHEADRLSIVVQGQLAASVAAGPVAEVFDELLVLLLHVQALRLFSHYFFPLSELAARKSAAASRDRVCCSPLSMSLTTTALAAASSGPMMQQKRALDLPA